MPPPALRKSIALVAFFSFLLSLLTVTSQAAFAAPSGTLTINDSGGGSLPAPSGGVYDIQTNITVAPADIEAALSSGNVTLWATSITVASDIDAPNTNSLTLKASGSIVVNSGVGITSQGGDLIFWADSDSSGSPTLAGGSVALLADSDVSSSNGSIVLAGGADSDADGIPDGYAYGDYAAGYAPWPWGGGDNGTAAVLLQKTSLDAGAGDIIVRGNGTGSAVNFQMGVWASESSVSGADISILGRASTQPTSSASDWGVMIRGTSVAGSGAISIQGWGGQASSSFSTNQDGIHVRSDGNGGNSSIIASGSGTISLTGQGGLGSVGGGSSQGIEVAEASQTIQTANGSISMSGQSGRLGLAEGLSLSSALESTGGDISLTATAVDDGGAPQDTNGAIAFAGASAASGTLTLSAHNEVTQTGAITAASIGLNGPAAYALATTTNQVGTVAAGATGSKITSLSFYDASGGLTIGQVGSLEGVTATGDVLIETGEGDITLARNIATDSTSGTAITLNSGDSTAAGTSTGGNIVVSGSPTLSTGANGIVRLFSGSEGGSTGLTDLAGGAPNVYYSVDESSSLSPSLSNGAAYALYRQAPPPPIDATHDIWIEGDGSGPDDGTSANLVLKMGTSSSSSGVKRVALLRFDYDPTYVWTSAALELVVSGNSKGETDPDYGDSFKSFNVNVYGANDADWAESSVTKSSAAATSSDWQISFTHPYSTPSATLLGNISVPANSTSPSGPYPTVGETFSLSNPDLVTFLNNDSDGKVTFFITRSDDSDQSNLSFASSENTTYDGPRLTVPGGGFSYPVAYDVNGGTGTVPDQGAYVVGAPYTVASPSSIIPPSGQSFAGWNSRSDGTGTAFPVGSSYSTSASVTLYAQYTSNPVVTFNSNDGTSQASYQAVSSGTATALTANPFTRSGFTFSGWDTSSGGGGTAYSDGSNITTASAVTLYAQWTANASGSSGGLETSGGSSASNPVVTPTTPIATPRQTRLTLVGPNTDPVPRPVERLGLRFDPDAPSRATVGGVPSNLVKTPVGSDRLSVAAGAFQFGVSLADADGAEV